MADQRIQCSEEMVGAGHPTKQDTLNRLMLVEHENDGTHKPGNIHGLEPTDSPEFVTVKLSGLSDGVIPYNVDADTGLADGPTKTDVDDAVTKKHAAGTDTTLGTMAADINMGTHQVTALSAPAAAGEAIRQTTKITEASLESAVDLKHAAVTISGTSPLSLSTQALSLKNNAGSPAAVTAVDTGTLADSDTVVPTSKAVKTYVDKRAVYYSSDYASLAAFVTAISTTEAHLIINRDEAVAASTTIPATVAVEVLRGCVITVATGQTLTINGPFHAGPYQVFSCTGTGKVVFGSGAVAEVFSEWFGAKGDNSTNDQPAIQKALNSISASDGVLKLLPKSYVVTSEIVVTGQNTICGSGKESTILKAGTATQNVIKINAPMYYPVTIRDLYIDTSVIKTGGAGIYVTASSGHNQFTVCENVRISMQYYGFYTYNAGAFYLDKCYIDTSRKAGVYVQNEDNTDSGDSTIINCHIIRANHDDVGTYGIYQVGSGGLKIIGTKILFHDIGYCLHNSKGDTSILLMVGNSIERSKYYGIYFTNSTTYNFQHIAIVGNQFMSEFSTAHIYCDSAYYTNFAITGNCFMVNKAGGVGVYFNGGSYGIIEGNAFSSDTTGTYGILISSSASYMKVGLNNYDSFGTNVYNESTTSNGEVTFGADNSGGTGYKVLRVPN